MIRDQWYVLLESDEVKSKPVGVTRMGEKMVFWRDERGAAHCAVDQCPHRGIQLSLGVVLDDHLQCPFHGFEYDASGACVYVPANGRGGIIPATLHLSVYPVHEAHGYIWVWWGRNPPAGLEPPTFFDNLDDSFYHASAHDPWDAHYSRVIENQLDVVHLPFIHRKSIGRGGRMLVDGPLIEWRNDKMLYTYVFNRVDDGTPPRKPSQLSAKASTSVHLEFILPNLWQNYISDDTRILAAFVPVDDSHTLLYLRFYQHFLPIPILGSLAAKLAMPANLYIAHEDRRVVVTHQPQPSGLKIGEALIQGDLPIIEYRRKRDELQKMSTSRQLSV
jgi:phenylpropionate dioxygenase-like ring-hydroxylating dioxygenase large terminal subunit